MKEWGHPGFMHDYDIELGALFPVYVYEMSVHYVICCGKLCFEKKLLWLVLLPCLNLVYLSDCPA